MNPNDSIKRSSDGVDIPLLRDLIPTAGIQDIAPMQNQKQDMDFAWLHRWGRYLILKREGGKE